MKNNRTEIYNKIGQEDFDDSIIFKHRRQKKPTDMATSINSLSSTSSDEPDGSIIKPVLMNVSTVSILPDLRSPDSILNDIEQKEKLLADVLSFDKIKINMDNLKEVESPTSTTNASDERKIKNEEVPENVCTNIPFTPFIENDTINNPNNFNNHEDTKPNNTANQTNGSAVKLYETLLIDPPGKL